MDDMNMNNEPPVYDSGDMKPTDPIPTEGENDAGLTEELPMYEDTSTGDRGGRKKIIAIAAGVVLIAGLGIGAFALSPHKTANTQPAEQEQTVTPVKDNSEEKTDNLSTSDIAKLCATLKLDDADLSIASDQVRVDAKSGRVLVTQVSEDDAAKMVDSTARRSAALATVLNGKKVKGVSAVDVTWVATDKDGNIKVAVAYDVTKAPTGGSTVDIINGSGGHVIADDIWSTDGVHDQGYDQNAGTVKKPDATPISTGTKTEEKKESDDKDQKSDDSKKEDNKASDSSKSDGNGDSSQSKQNSGNSQNSGSNNSSSNGGSQKKWIAEQGHWETDYSQVWVPNVVYTRHERWICSACHAAFGSAAEMDAHAHATFGDAQHPNGGSAINDSYTTSEDQGHYEQQATGQHWVVDVAGHGE